MKMRYRQGGNAVDAIQWNGFERGSTPTVDDLHALGIPVVQSARGSDPLLTIFEQRTSSHRLVSPGDWLVSGDVPNDADCWYAIPDGVWREGGFVPIDVEEQPELDALPGLSVLTLSRVGYRRWDEDTRAYSYRSNGLTVREMNEQGWEPLYTVTARSEASVAESADGD